MTATAPAPTTVLASLNGALHSLMERSGDVYVIGEDVLDPYGGAFKVTKGLSTRFPARVLTTPISEAAIVGTATGMALRGLRPIAEIMFGDFLMLAADQLVNHAAKFRWMYNEQASVPLVVRTPVGGRRGYGPTHSQTLEKMFLGVPGLRVVAPNALANPGALLTAAVADDDDPVLFIEHKLLYAQPLLEPGRGSLSEFQSTVHGERYPTHTLRMAGARAADVTIACYGYAFEIVREAALSLLLEDELFVEIVLFTQLSPFELDPLSASLARTGKLVVVEEGGLTLGWGAEVVARMTESSAAPVRARRVAARDLPIANARTLEDATLPQVADVRAAALSLAGREVG